MTRNQFIEMCNRYYILPDIAFENENINSILTNNLLASQPIKRAKLIEEILINEF